MFDGPDDDPAIFTESEVYMIAGYLTVSLLPLRNFDANSVAELVGQAITEVLALKA